MMTVLLLALGAAPMDLEALIDPAWKEVELASTATKQGPGLSWDYRVSPPFPSEWPMTSKSTLVRWVYATAMDMSISDGQRVAGAWARIDVAADGTAKLTPASKTLEGNDIQGIKPLMPQQLEQLKKVYDTGDALRANDLSATKPSWCAWLRYNGVIAAKLKPKHEAFFKALACDVK